MSFNDTFSSFFASPPSCSVSLEVSFLESDSWERGGSSSTTMCFLSRDQPLSFDFIMPFGFWITLRRGSAAGRESFLLSVNCVVEVNTDFSSLASWLSFGLARTAPTVFSGAVCATGKLLFGFVTAVSASEIIFVGVLRSVDSFNSFCCATLTSATGDSVFGRRGVDLMASMMATAGLGC
uniref:Uncharacterized protein n=1 Tax=Esox lucius TaxID=8010 RepID=A0AAY5JWB5_ESOLU